MQSVINKTGITEEQLSELLSESPSYIRGLLVGELMPSRSDVRKIASELGEDTIKHLILAGYVPEESMVYTDLYEMLTSILLGSDERMKNVIRMAMEEAVRD